MNLYNILDRYIFLPLGDLVYGSRVASKFNELRRNEHLSSEQLKALQQKKLQKLIRHCYKTVPYYTRLFDQLGIIPDMIKTLEDLQKLPPLLNN